jgi:hypothetical protein
MLEIAKRVRRRCNLPRLPVVTMDSKCAEHPKACLLAGSGGSLSSHSGRGVWPAAGSKLWSLWAAYMP